MPAGLSAGTTTVSRFCTKVCGSAVTDAGVGRVVMAVLEAKAATSAGSALGQLGDQRLGAGEVVDDVEPRIGGFEVGFDLGEGIGQRRGGEDGQRAGVFREGNRLDGGRRRLRHAWAGGRRGRRGGIAGPRIDLGGSDGGAGAERPERSASGRSAMTFRSDEMHQTLLAAIEYLTSQLLTHCEDASACQACCSSRRFCLA